MAYEIALAVVVALATSLAQLQPSKLMRPATVALSAGAVGLAPVANVLFELAVRVGLVLQGAYQSADAGWIVVVRVCGQGGCIFAHRYTSRPLRVAKMR